MDIIKIQNYDFAYHNYQVLNGINLTLKAGEIVGIIGVNGSGKTTLIKSILGELKGSNPIMINDEIADLNNLTQRKEIFYISDDADIPNYLTLNEYLKFIHQIYNINDDYFLNEKNTLTKIFEMDQGLEYKLIKNYSHGMRKKLQIIAALLTQPKLFLIDEPTNGLDILMIYQLKKVLKQQKEKKISALISSHDMGFVLEVCDRVVFLKDGKLSTSYDTNKITIQELENLFMDWKDEL